MFVEVDQSVKVEFTGQDTVLAKASTNRIVPVVRTVLVPAAAKRKGLLILRATYWRIRTSRNWMASPSTSSTRGTRV